MSAEQVRHVLGDHIFNSYFKFAMIRNPWNKALSQYRYMAKRPDLMRFIGMTETDCLKRYLELIKKKEHAPTQVRHECVWRLLGRLCWSIRVIQPSGTTRHTAHRHAVQRNSTP